MARDINPSSNSVREFYAELNKHNDISKLNAYDIGKIREKIPKIPTWSPFTFLERRRVINDLKNYNNDINLRIYDLVNTAKNGFEDILVAIRDERHNCLINPELIESIIDNPESTFGAKREMLIKAFYVGFKDIKDDPAIKEQIDGINDIERESLIALKDAFLNAKGPAEKSKMLKTVNIDLNLPITESYKKLCLIGADDPQFIRAVLFELPYEAQPPQYIREAFISLFFQGAYEKYDPPASYKKIKETIRQYDYESIPKKLEVWKDLVEKNSNSSLRTLSPDLKDLSKRLTAHTGVSLGEYFKSVFSPSLRNDISRRKELAKSIPKIEELRQNIKKKVKDRAHFKNVKRNCVTLDKNQNLPALRLKYRKEVGKNIPLKKLDQALDKLNDKDISGFKDLVKEYGIENEEALIKLLVIRASHYPSLAAQISLYIDEPDEAIKAIAKKMNRARSEVWKTLMSYE